MTVTCRSRCVVCSCEPGFVCSRCARSPFDDGYLDDERTVHPDEFEAMSLARVAVPIMLGEDS